MEIPKRSSASHDLPSTTARTHIHANRAPSENYCVPVVWTVGWSFRWRSVHAARRCQEETELDNATIACNTAIMTSSLSIYLFILSRRAKQLSLRRKRAYVV